MCQLCFMINPFAFDGSSGIDAKKVRAKLIKDTLNSLSLSEACNNGKEEIEKLKEEQYLLSKDI